MSARAVLAVLALALACAAASAQPQPSFLKKAREHGIAPEAGGKPADAAQKCLDLVSPKPEDGAWCADLDSCVAYCRCACAFDVTKWKKDERDDGAAVCRRFPAEGPRMIPADSPLLRRITPVYEFIDVDGAPRAAQEVLDALDRLDAKLRASPHRRERGYRIRVGSCYRPAQYDSQPECGYVLKARHMLDKTRGDEAQQQHWRRLGDPNNLGLAWPGATTHSAGLACDLVLVDKRGNDCYDWRAGVTAPKGGTAPPTCSIKPRDAARYAVEEITDPSVGGRRLSYEAWHFEWDSSNPAARCAGAGCDGFWPLTGHP